jgi:hypothetical protein
MAQPEPVAVDPNAPNDGGPNPEQPPGQTDANTPPDEETEL